MLAAHASRLLNSLASAARFAREEIRRYTPFGFFAAGFGWDALTLERIDRLRDNVILLVYIAALGTLAFVNIDRAGRLRHALLRKWKLYFPAAIQFLFGVLLSAYVLFYFRSASMTKTGIFVLVLFVLLIAVKFFRLDFSNPPLQAGLFFVATSSFLTFFLPVLFKKLNVYIFLSAVLLSVALTVGGAYLLWRASLLSDRSVFHEILCVVGALLVLLIGFYFGNWIPPIPLSARNLSIFHT